jgi:hypothetical protein
VIGLGLTSALFGAFLFSRKILPQDSSNIADINNTAINFSFLLYFVSHATSHLIN